MKLSAILRIQLGAVRFFIVLIASSCITISLVLRWPGMPINTISVVTGLLFGAVGIVLLFGCDAMAHRFRLFQLKKWEKFINSAEHRAPGIALAISSQSYSWLREWLSKDIPTAGHTFMVAKLFEKGILARTSVKDGVRTALLQYPSSEQELVEAVAKELQKLGMEVVLSALKAPTNEGK